MPLQLLIGKVLGCVIVTVCTVKPENCAVILNVHIVRLKKRTVFARTILDEMSMRSKSAKIMALR